MLTNCKTCFILISVKQIARVRSKERWEYENYLGFLLESNDISKTKLAKDLGVTRTTINRAVNGKTPSLELALKIAIYFKKDVSDIFFIKSVKRV
jgi:DNA-binding XRE family transcriptional regulator